MAQLLEPLLRMEKAIEGLRKDLGGLKVLPAVREDTKATAELLAELRDDSRANREALAEMLEILRAMSTGAPAGNGAANSPPRRKKSAAG